MDHRIFIKACELLKASGSSYEELISPFWSEVQDGVVLPTLGKLIPRLAPDRCMLTWDDSMAFADAVGLTLPSREELQYMYHHLDQINGLLLANNGDRLPRNMLFWSCTEYSKASAWSVYFGSGTTGTSYKYSGFYVRPLAELKKYKYE